MKSVRHDTRPPEDRARSAKAIRVGVWFAFIGGLAIPLVLWAIMASSILLLGPEVGLKVGVVAESLLTMIWPTVIVLIAPGLGIGVITALLVINMLLWGAVGFLSEQVISRPLAYYGFVSIVVFGLLVCNGSFVWMAFETPVLPLNLIDVPTFVIAAAAVTVVFFLRRLHALKSV